MSHSSAALAELSAEQRQVVEAPVGARQLVLGGAGTGKTHLLVARIRHLIENEDVAPGSEILVLSFTRAVVRELKDRLATTTGAARMVRPFTFDSFATRLLMQTRDERQDWREAGYDGRIAAATKALSNGGDAAAVLQSYRQTFVDEVQDLVGVRADFVLELLRHVGAFTVLGDPAQAIFDHQVRDRREATTSEQFLGTLIEQCADLQTFVLPTDYRCRHAYGEQVRVVGEALRDPKRPVQPVRELLVEILDSLDYVGSFEDLAFALRGTHERTAVLCRTNAECLRVSQLLFEANVDHRLQQDSGDRVLPSWLARLFRGVDRTRWSPQRLEALIDMRIDQGVRLPPTESVVRFLTDAVGDDTVDLDLLRTRLQRGVLPDHLHEPGDVPIVISTIHRAKGLEFDRVFFGAPRNGVPAEEELEELRILYVALSRGRDDLWTFKAPNMAHWHKANDERWAQWPWKEPRKTLGWEVRPSDVDNLHPPGAGIATTDVARLQDRLATPLPRGLPAELRLVHVRQSEEPIPFYSLIAEDMVIGETNEPFGEQLRRRLRQKGSNVTFPPHLTKLFVAGAETVIGPASEGEANGLGTSGMWLRARVSGLAEIDWHVDE